MYINSQLLLQWVVSCLKVMFYTRLGLFADLIAITYIFLRFLATLAFDFPSIWITCGSLYQASVASYPPRRKKFTVLLQHRRKNKQA